MIHIVILERNWGQNINNELFWMKLCLERNIITNWKSPNVSSVASKWLQIKTGEF